MLSFIKQFGELTKDFIGKVEVEKILEGKKLFRPFISYNKAWASYFYPEDNIHLMADTWFYLNKYMLPLIKTHASNYHLEGMSRLKLDKPNKPDFKAFQKIFNHESNGFKIQPVNKEISPKEYFQMIQKKKFPCIEKTRSFDELFCGFEPDFWHDAIGHIAPLCFPEIQEFYLKIADYMLSAKTETEFNRHLAIAWTLTEYGFIKEKYQDKMFGAALVGSHLAHMRYLHKIIAVEPATRISILNSNFYSEIAPLAKNGYGKLRFFCMNNLNIDTLFTE